WPSLGQTRASAVWPTSNTGCSSASPPRPGPAGVASGGSPHADGCAARGTPHSAPDAHAARARAPPVSPGVPTVRGECPWCHPTTDWVGTGRVAFRYVSPCPPLDPYVRLSPHTAHDRGILWERSSSPAPQCIPHGQLTRSLGTCVLFPDPLPQALRHVR